MSHRTDPCRARLSGTALLVLVAVLIVSACDPSSPSPSPSASPSPASSAPSPAPTLAPSASAGGPAASADPAGDAIYDTVEQEVIAIRGLKPSRPVERQFITEADLRVKLTEMFDEDTPPAYLAANERLYKALGLIPATSNLRDLSLDLLSGGVAGFYRNDQGKLYVVSKSGGPGPNERFYFAHEYDHALQDQNSTVFKDQDGILDQSDRLLARASVYEGDATLLMTQWAADNLTQAELLEVIAGGSDPAVQAVLDRTPAILKDTLTFPYTTGFGFVTPIQTAGGWPAVDALFTKMPASTEQILHPDKYTAGEAPIAVTLPADLATRLGTGWSVPLQDTFGEFQLGIWLRESGVASADATAAAAGWGGDRLAVMEGPDGAWAVVLDTTWDSEKDAIEFADAAQTAVKASPHKGHISAPTAKRVTILIASDDAALQELDVIFGATGV
jgi:hypothetical protein